mmetsp:Transcript_10786/g.22974  ORF Transcript_10786/g.22974 Transcript_10786/m.22974 type:complete len:302 (+) Transcript_10786:332-1237(+)
MTTNHQAQHQQQQHEQKQRRAYDMSTVEECYDGTICENNSRCVPHPFKEGSYMCDCKSVIRDAQGGNASPTSFAGLYCEHRATTYCQKDSSSSLHAFCTNNGECLKFVSKTQAHTGCKCPKGYEGDYCEYVVGSAPDWEFDLNRLSAMGYETGYNGGSSSSFAGDGGGAMPIIGIVVGSVVGFIAIAVMLTCFLWTGTITDKIAGLAKGKKSSSENGNGTSSEFVGGQSVYKKKASSTRALVIAPEAIDADGGMLTEAMREKQQQLELEEIGSPSKEELHEVNLDDLPSSLYDDGGKKEII